MKDDGEGLLAVAIMVFLVGVAFGALINNSSWKDDSVKQGFAEYNNTTGDWQWKVVAEKGKQ